MVDAFFLSVSYLNGIYLFKVNKETPEQCKISLTKQLIYQNILVSLLLIGFYGMIVL